MSESRPQPMPYEVRLSRKLRNAGWKAKVYDNEVGPEEPHFTIIHRSRTWRVSLRTGDFLIPPGGRWSDIPEELTDAVADEETLAGMRAYWDAANPHNPVRGSEDDPSH